MSKLILKATVHATDNGDGSNSYSFYNSQDDLLAELRKYYDYDDESIQSLLDEDDPYTHGYIVSTTIEVDTETGRFKPFYVSTG